MKILKAIRDKTGCKHPPVPTNASPLEMHHYCMRRSEYFYAQLKGLDNSLLIRYHTRIGDEWAHLARYWMTKHLAKEVTHDHLTYEAQRT